MGNLEEHSFILRKLQPSDWSAFIAAYLEFKESNDFDFVSFYEEGMDSHELIAQLEEREKGLNLPESYVPSTYLFGFSGSKLVGRTMIRHQLNDFLRKIGGHIGYGVVPSERGKGFGKKLLQHALPIARNIGLEKVLLTCDENNLHSRNIIEGSGGQFSSITDQGPNLPKKRLYWISTTNYK